MVDAEAQGQTSRLEGEKSRLEQDVRQHVHTEKALETQRDFFAAVLESVDAFILARGMGRAGSRTSSPRVASSSPRSRYTKPPRR